MKFRDVLYFSKGERRALSLLLCLIIVAWLVLILTEEPAQPTSRKDVSSIPHDTIIGIKPTRHTLPSPEKKPAEKKSIFAVKKFERPASSSPSYPRPEKYPVGTIVELNTADSLTLKKVPGIGNAFSRRIVRYRDLLGGFYNIAQLAEVYGIDETKYEALKSWFIVDSTFIRTLTVNTLTSDSLSRHPYINYRQAKAIYRLRQQKGSLSGWENLCLLPEFTEDDKRRIAPYLSFE